MKLSDYVADFLSKKGITHVFVVTGGASVHLIDSVAKHPDIKYICCQHEQAAAMAADGYSRASGNLGAAVSTSGPGATNLLTGICCAYYDSVPVLYITGQVSTFRSNKGTGVRQIGFQETDVVSMFRLVTNYAVQLEDAGRIRYELEKACFLAKQGRPGPVLVDIPDNLQRAEINPAKLAGFTSIVKTDTRAQELDRQVDACAKMLEKARRPVIILGWGVRLSGAVKEAVEFINTRGVPFLPTWAAADLLPSDHPASVGTFGTHGTRYANFAVQNADFVLSVGSRLDTKATGSPVSSFARGAEKAVVDIDRNELEKFNKFGLKIHLPICCDAKLFLQKLNLKLKNTAKTDISPWIDQIAYWKKKYPICPAHYYSGKNVNPYVFVEKLSEIGGEGATFVTDTGCCLAWMMQGFRFKKNQRILHDWNNTAMGWALAASIGAVYAKKNSSVICVTGDGSLQMNIQELGTIIRHKLPIKIFLINNKGYGMIRQTQDQWLDSHYDASSVQGGLPDPDFLAIARAYGFSTLNISRNKEIGEGIRTVIKNKGPIFCNVDVNPDHRVIPQVKFGRPNEDAEPLLGRQQFLKNMLISPLACSLDK